MLTKHVPYTVVDTIRTGTFESMTIYDILFFIYTIFFIRLFIRRRHGMRVSPILVYLGCLIISSIIAHLTNVCAFVFIGAYCSDRTIFIWCSSALLVHLLCALGMGWWGVTIAESQAQGTHGRYFACRTLLTGLFVFGSTVAGTIGTGVLYSFGDPVPEFPMAAFTAISWLVLSCIAIVAAITFAVGGCCSLYSTLNAGASVSTTRFLQPAYRHSPDDVLKSEDREDDAVDEKGEEEEDLVLEVTREG